MDNVLDYLNFLVREFEKDKNYLPNTVALAQLELIVSTMDKIIEMGKGDLIPSEYVKYRSRRNLI